MTEDAFNAYVVLAAGRFGLHGAGRAFAAAKTTQSRCRSTKVRLRKKRKKNQETAKGGSTEAKNIQRRYHVPGGVAPRGRHVIGETPKGTVYDIRDDPEYYQTCSAA